MNTIAGFKHDLNQRHKWNNGKTCSRCGMPYHWINYGYVCNEESARQAELRDIRRMILTKQVLEAVRLRQLLGWTVTVTE